MVPSGYPGFSFFHYSVYRINDQIPFEIIEIETKGVQCIYETEDLELLTFPLQHRIKCQGYLFREKKETFHFKQAGIDCIVPDPCTNQIGSGEKTSFCKGRIDFQGATLSSPSPLMSYAYCSDTAFFPELIPWLKSVKVLVP